MENISLFKVGRKGYWYIQYRTDDGSRKQKSTGCKNKTEAVKVLAEFKSFLAESLFKRKGNSLLSSFVTNFLSFAETNYSKHTTYLYKRTLEGFQRINGDRTLNHYTAKHFDLYKVTRLKEFVQGKIPKKAPKRCMSPITINIELRCLRAAFNTALRWEMIEKNPFEKMQQIPIPKRTPAFLTADDVVKLLNVIQKPWLKDVIIFAVNTGMRRGELLSLRWQDINKELKIAHISNTDDFTTKTGEERIVALNDAALEVINKCNHSPLHEYLFSIEGGHRLLPQFLTHQFKEAARAAGLSEAIHLHSTRHSFASFLVGNGTSLFTVSKLLGHSSTKTSEIYSHLLPQHLHSEVQKISFGKR
jgi:site-specific recombinase XerD